MTTRLWNGLLTGGLALIVLIQLGCTRKQAELGSAENPVKFFFVPSVDAKLLEDKAKLIQKYLEANTPYKIKIQIPASYVAVVESFGTERADVASLNTFGYILANEKYGAEAHLTVLRYGKDTYQSAIWVRADGPIKKIEDLQGKRFAYVDPASTSGYLLPAKMLADKSIKPSETVFANKHDNVITMLYQGRVDAGATFYTPPNEKGEVQDARRLVLKQFPDAESKIKLLTLTEPIPNDPIVFRKGLPNEMKVKIRQALVDYMNSEEGKIAFHEIYGANGMKIVDDRSYDSVRDILRSLGKSAADLMKK